MLAKRLFLSIFKLVPIFLEVSMTQICSAIHDVQHVYPVFIPNTMLWVILTVMCLIYLISQALNYCIWHKLMLLTAIIQLILFQIFSNPIVLIIGGIIFSLITICYFFNYVKNSPRNLIKTSRG